MAYFCGTMHWRPLFCHYFTHVQVLVLILIHLPIQMFQRLGKLLLVLLCACCICLFTFYVPGPILVDPVTCSENCIITNSFPYKVRSDLVLNHLCGKGHLHHIILYLEAHVGFWKWVSQIRFLFFVFSSSHPTHSFHWCNSWHWLSLLGWQHVVPCIILTEP